MKSIVSYQVTKIFLPEAPERTTWTSPASRTWLTRSLVNIPFCFVCLFIFSVYSRERHLAKTEVEGRLYCLVTQWTI